MRFLGPPLSTISPWAAHTTVGTSTLTPLPLNEGFLCYAHWPVISVRLRNIIGPLALNPSNVELWVELWIMRGDCGQSIETRLRRRVYKVVLAGCFFFMISSEPSVVLKLTHHVYSLHDLRGFHLSPGRPSICGAK